MNAKAVILATGGFGANDAMVPEEYKQFVYAGHAGATGDGLKDGGSSERGYLQYGIRQYAAKLDDSAKAA